MPFENDRFHQMRLYLYKSRGKHARHPLVQTRPHAPFTTVRHDMHFFDPTVDWPKDLLDPLVPDLFIVQSETSLDSNSAWNDPSRSSPWNTPWIEYAALDREERFINMTFFNTRSASRDEKKLISERSEGLDDGAKSIGWYRSTSSVGGYFATLQKSK